LAAESKESNGEIFNIACGERISLNQLVDYLNEIMQKDCKAEYQGPRKGDVLHSLADISKGAKILEYKPLVNFKEGLKRIIERYVRDSALFSAINC